jgi:homoserine kinase type II
MAVFTEISELDLGSLLANYDIGTLVSYSGISDGIQNSNFIIKTDKNKFILTIFEDERILNDLPFFFNFTEYLSSHDIPCPKPIYAKNGKIFQTICGKPSAIVSFLSGKWPQNIRKAHCREIGKYSALLHKSAADFKSNRANPHPEILYRYNLLNEQGVDINSFKPGLKREIEESAEYIISNWSEDLPSGVVHGDLFPDNTIFDGDKLTGIIDFYSSHNDLFVADLANTLTQWCFQHGDEFNITNSKAMLLAYNNERPLSDEEITALPIMAAAAAMKWFLNRLYSWFNPPEGAMVNQKDPLDQLKKLRFHLQVKSVSAYGLDL